MSYQPQYTQRQKLYVFDSFQTLVRREEEDAILGFARKDAEIRNHFGERNIEGVISQGLADTRADRKDTDSFKTYMDLYNMSMRRGYGSKELKTPLMPHARETLSRIKEAGRQQGIEVKIAIYSSVASDACKTSYDQDGIGTYVDAYHSSDEPGLEKKKDAASWRKIAELHNVDVRDVVGVSDSPNEVEAARDAGYSEVYHLEPSTPGKQTPERATRISSLETIAEDAEREQSASETGSNPSPAEAS